MIALLLEKSMHFSDAFLQMFRMAAPFWLLGIVVGSAISQLLPVRAIRRCRFTHGFYGVVVGALLGIISPVGLYGALPITAALAAAGVPSATIFAYLIATPLINPNIFIFTAGVFGYQMAFARLVAALLLGIAGGCILLLLGMVKKTALIGGQAWNFSGTAAQGHHGKRGQASNPGSLHGFYRDSIRFLRFSTPYFLLAISIAAVIRMSVPDKAVAAMLGAGNPFSVLFASVLSIPLYMCGGNTIPFIHELVGAGMNKGAALAFFIAGPATKISNVTFLSSMLGIRGVVFFLTMTLAAAIAAGYWYGFFP